MMWGLVCELTIAARTADLCAQSAGVENPYTVHSYIQRNKRVAQLETNGAHEHRNNMN